MPVVQGVYFLWNFYYLHGNITQPAPQLTQPHEKFTTGRLGGNHNTLLTIQNIHHQQYCPSTSESFLTIFHNIVLSFCECHQFSYPLTTKISSDIFLLCSLLRNWLCKMCHSSIATQKTAIGENEKVHIVLFISVNFCSIFSITSQIIKILYF